MRESIAGLLAAALLLSGMAQAADALNSTFDFSSDAEAGAVPVRTMQSYDQRRGYGFEPQEVQLPAVGAVTGKVFKPKTDLQFTNAGVAGAGPFAFSAAAPEGDYRVQITLTCTGPCAIKAEARRLIWMQTDTAGKKTYTVERIVNVRSPMLPAPPANAPGGIMIRLNPREYGSKNWDQKLTLTFFGKSICVTHISVSHAEPRRLFLMGDSTVTDQPVEPYASWGQMLPVFLKNTVSVANFAESGETLKSFFASLRLDKVLSEMRPGDYVMIQFAHNDEKASWPQTYAAADSTYPVYLQAYITEIRRHGGVPVLVTPMVRRKFDASGHLVKTHGSYPDAIRKVAQDFGVPLIDLNAMSRTLFEAMGPKKAPHAFAGEGVDHTHQSNYGGYELARCIVLGLKGAHVSLSEDLRDVPDFDPAHPDDPKSVQVLYP